MAGPAGPGPARLDPWDPLVGSGSGSDGETRGRVRVLCLGPVHRVSGNFALAWHLLKAFGGPLKLGVGPTNL